MATRDGSARWRGDVRAGSRHPDRRRGHPDRQLAAAHAACISMAASMQLSEAGHPPTSIGTQARVHLRIVEGRPTIQLIDLECQADVPGLDETAFHEQVERAKANCIPSRALAGVEHVNVSASLAS